MSEIRTDTINNASGDNDSGIDLSTNDKVAIKTADTTVATFDSTGNLMLGNTTAPSAASSNAPAVLISGPNDATLQLSRENATAGGGAIQSNAGAGLKFYTHTGAVGSESYSERMRIDSNGRMTISSDGQAAYSTIASFEVRGQNAPLAKINHTQNADEVALQMRHDYARTSGQTATMIQFLNNGGAERGTIKTSDTATSFNTSSDHRLKENVTADWDATTRLKQLNPVRFNFISDADTTVDGFLAHEVQSVVPEAITGTYNEVKVWREHEELPDGVSVGDNKLDEDGNTIPVYQGIDQAKLVPLLVKTIQELEARITALESE